VGQIRNGPVFIYGSNYVPPPSRDELDILLNELFDWYNVNREIYNPSFLAAVFHYKFVFIQPFEDGNGRISRLIMNFILHKNQYPYFKALERSTLENSPMRFISWCYPRYLKFVEKRLQSIGFIL